MPRLCQCVATTLILTACQAPLPDPPESSTATQSASVSVEPEAPLDAVAAVLRVRIEVGATWDEPPEDVLLVSGELSDYHLNRIAKQDLPQTLIERTVPVLAWREETSVVLAPTELLAAGELYSLASPRLGELGRLRVSDQPPPLLQRLWPPAEGGTGSARLIYCAREPVPIAWGSTRLDPGALAVDAAAGVDSRGTAADTCVSLVPRAAPQPGARLVPAPELFGLALDPAPIDHLEHVEPDSASCEIDETALGPGCARVEDDRMVVRSRPEPALWSIVASGASAVEPVGAGERFVFRGLSPATEHTIDLTVLDLSGRARSATALVHTLPARARLVVSEVLANPLGPEPQQEWVELVNDGSLPVDLAEFVLEDLGGVTLLPGRVLSPGERVVVASEAFVNDDGLDLPVDEAVLVRVEKLGKNGLSNSGEPLTLRAASGEVVSRFPAAPKPKAGVSVARRRPWDLDDDPAAFAHHAEPGASPGAPNALE